LLSARIFMSNIKRRRQDQTREDRHDREEVGNVLRGAQWGLSRVSMWRGERRKGAAPDSASGSVLGHVAAAGPVELTFKIPDSVNPTLRTASDWLGIKTTLHKLRQVKGAWAVAPREPPLLPLPSLTPDEHAPVSPISESPPSTPAPARSSERRSMPAWRPNALFPLVSCLHARSSCRCPGR
jgi:hypothetical protein